MSSKVINKEKNKVTIEFSVSQEEFEKAIDKAYLKVRNKINVQGFRKGKAPKKIIEARYGKSIFYEDALDIVIPQAYSNAVDETKIDVINQPDIDIKEFEEGKDIILTAEVEVMPDVKLCDYKSIEVEKVEYTVTDEDIENELKKTQEQNARMVEVDNRSVVEGDTLTIDYSGFVGEEQFDGGTAENQTLVIGSKTFIPGFEEQLIGKNKEEDIEINVTFPEDYQAEELKGKDAVFKVKIHEIKEKELPELDDEFAKDVSEFDTLEELRKDTEEKLINDASQKEKNTNENNIITKIVEESEVDAPQVMIDREIDFQGKNYEQQLRSQGFGKEMDQFIQQLVDQYKENFKKQAEFNVKTELVISEVIKAESIEATEDEIDSEIKKLAESYKLEEDKMDDFIKNMKESNSSYFKESLQKRKAFEFLINNAKLVDSVEKEDNKDKEE